MDLTTQIIQMGAMVTAVTVISAFGGKWLCRQLEPINNNIIKMDLNNSKCYLVNFLTDIENGIKKDDVQIQLAYEIYDHYVKDLKGNSYIHDKWDKLMK